MCVACVCVCMLVCLCACACASMCVCDCFKDPIRTLLALALASLLDERVVFEHDPKLLLHPIRTLLVLALAFLLDQNPIQRQQTRSNENWWFLSMMRGLLTHANFTKPPPRSNVAKPSFGPPPHHRGQETSNIYIYIYIYHASK